MSVIYDCSQNARALDRKSLPGKDTLILQKFENYGEKSFIKFAPGPNVINLFMSVIY